MFTGGFAKPQATLKQKGMVTKRRSRSQSETRRHSKGDRKGEMKGKRPQGTSPSGKSNQLVCTLKESSCDCCHLPEYSHNKSQSGCQWRGACVFKHTGQAGEDKNGRRTIAITTGETKEFSCVLKGGHTTTFSERSILRRFGWTLQRRNSEFDAVEPSSKDPTMIAIRTLFCINSGLNIVKNRRELQRGNCSN